MSLSVSYLEKIIESEKLPKAVNETLTIFLAAINDWPNPIVSLFDYEKDIYKLIGKEVDKKNLEEYISKIDFSKNAWVAESLCQLIEVYNYFEDYKLLKEILNEIKENIGEQ